MGDPTQSAAAFTEQILLRPLWPHQVPAADSDAFIVTIGPAARSAAQACANLPAAA